MHFIKCSLIICRHEVQCFVLTVCTLLNVHLLYVDMQSRVLYWNIQHSMGAIFLSTVIVVEVGLMLRKYIKAIVPKDNTFFLT